MKKILFLFISIFMLSANGCTVVYNNESNPPQTEETQPDNTDTANPTIDNDALFFPADLSPADNKIAEYTYIDDKLTNEYTVYSAYYSAEYDTIYIAYDLINSPKQTLKAKDLYEIELHAINYFISDKNRSEDKEYLKAVRIYPDKLASSCRKGLTDEQALNINGCADYGGKEAIIDLNSTTSLQDFYTPKYSYQEPIRDTFAHEYGHISTFYHMIYKGDENYEDYLKLRLGSYYSTIYPHGLPENYSSSSSYKIQPEEILADDFVELFYNKSNKLPNDTYNYNLNYVDYRNSLEGYPNVQMIKNNPTLYNQLINYYSKFLNYTNRTNYNKPIIVSSTNKIISYYESLSHIGNNTLIKEINSIIDTNLIAVGEVTFANTKYYRVILSNTYSCPLNGSNRYCDRKDVGEKMGYVLAQEYTENTDIKLYKIDQNGGSPLSKTNIVPIENNKQNNLYILPFYDTAYVINTTNDINHATTYDYLSENLSATQTYKVNIHSFASLIN